MVTNNGLVRLWWLGDSFISFRQMTSQLSETDRCPESVIACGCIYVFCVTGAHRHQEQRSLAAGDGSPYHAGAPRAGRRAGGIAQSARRPFGRGDSLGGRGKTLARRQHRAVLSTLKPSLSAVLCLLWRSVILSSRRSQTSTTENVTPEHLCTLFFFCVCTILSLSFGAAMGFPSRAPEIWCVLSCDWQATLLGQRHG